MSLSGMDGPAWVTLATLALCFATASLVGWARGKYRIVAPATTGHEMFDRAYRVQMNTLENTVMFLPALWLAAHYVGTTFATIAGAAWLIGRIWYAVGYMQSPGKRGRGFVIAYAAWAALMLGVTWGLLANLFALFSGK